jgi:hypothetical protein
VLGAAVIHTFAQLERLAGGPIVRVAGEARRARERAPFVPAVHDVRRLRQHTPAPEEAARFEWRACDADGACAALLSLAPTTADRPAVQAVIVASAMAPETYPENGWRLHGDEGTLIATGVHLPESQFSLLAGPKAEPKALAVPERIWAALPKVGNDLENNWGALFRDFLADIRGEPHAAYPTFRDGWRYQIIIDAIRSASGWQEVPA